MKLLLKVVLALIVLVVLVVGGGIFFLARGIEAGAEVSVSSLDLSKVKDGIYNGEYKSGRWTNEISVEVKDSRIVKMAIVKDVMFVKPEVSGELFAKVLKKQNTDVDAVSGATITSKAYLKAIEDALKY